MPITQELEEDILPLIIWLKISGKNISTNHNKTVDYMMTLNILAFFNYVFPLSKKNVTKKKLRFEPGNDYYGRNHYYITIYQY